MSLRQVKKNINTVKMGTVLHTLRSRGHQRREKLTYDWNSRIRQSCKNFVRIFVINFAR